MAIVMAAQLNEEEVMLNSPTYPPTHPLKQGELAIAIVMAAQLNEEKVMLKALEAAPPSTESLALLARSLPPSLAPRLLSLLAKRLPKSPHLAYLLHWSLALLQAHGATLRKVRSPTHPPTDPPTHPPQVQSPHSNRLVLLYLLIHPPTHRIQPGTDRIFVPYKGRF